MLLIYALWFLGVIFGLLTAVEVAIIIYKICNKNKKLKSNIILAIITAILCIGFSSSAIITVFDRVIKSNITISSVSKDLGKISADMTANAYQSFIETWDETVKEEAK